MSDLQEARVEAALNAYEAEELALAGSPPRMPSRHMQDWTEATQSKMRAALAAADAVLIRCDYCNDDLPSVRHRSHLPTTPSLQRLGFDADRITCSECAMRARRAHEASVTAEQITEVLLDTLQDLKTGPLSDAGFSDAEITREDHLELREDFDSEIPDVVIDVPQLARDIHAQLSREEVADDESEAMRRVSSPEVDAPNP